MPTYDYVCVSCGHQVEVMHSVHADGPSVCAVCGGPMKKAIGVPAVHYKGSGWARKEKSSAGKASRVDRKDAGSSAGGGDESSDASGGGSSGSSDSSSGSESKPPAAVAAADSPSKEHD